MSLVDRIRSELKRAHARAVRNGWSAGARRTRAARKALAPKPVPQPTPAVTLTFPQIAAARDQSKHGPQFGQNECMLRCRLACDAPAIGDFDGDGSADAEDGYKFAKIKHGPLEFCRRGGLAWWGGGSHDNGHVAIIAGKRVTVANVLRWVTGRPSEVYVWSTDIRRPGFFDLVPLTEINEKWGLPYLGWSEDINGVKVEVQ